MRGSDRRSGELFSYVDVEKRVRSDHPLRAIRSIVNETLEALEELAMPTIMLWPNVDAGSEDIARGMRKFRERHRLDFIRFYKNFPVETYLRLMKSAACLVGNSSSSITIGWPVRFWNASPMVRATRSVAPPGAKGTTTRTGLAG